MKELTPDQDFSREVNCTYNGERYTVRDNGAVLRYPRVEKLRTRPTDNQWTFGKPNQKTGYSEIASVRVHRIVATAFHREPPTKEHVVDHIDTIKQNNRPENLRWVTRLENVLLNPITAKRIAMVCGSVQAFLENPAKFRDRFLVPNFKWMRNVTKEEGQNCLKNLTTWAKSDKQYSGGSLDNWIFNRNVWQNQHVEGGTEVPEIMMAKTPNAAQLSWRIPSEFPCCPKENNEEPIVAYFKKLITGSVFCQNETYSSFVLKSAISDDRKTIYVISESSEGENAVKPWAIAKITFEDGLFLHTSLGSFFTKEGAEKHFCLAQGLEWTCGDSIDDYC